MTSNVYLRTIRKQHYTVIQAKHTGLPNVAREVSAESHQPSKTQPKTFAASLESFAEPPFKRDNGSLYGYEVDSNSSSSSKGAETLVQEYTPRPSVGKLRVDKGESHTPVAVAGRWPSGKLEPDTLRPAIFGFGTPVEKASSHQSNTPITNVLAVPTRVAKALSPTGKCGNVD